MGNIVCIMSNAFVGNVQLVVDMALLWYDCMDHDVSLSSSSSRSVCFLTTVYISFRKFDIRGLYLQCIDNAWRGKY
jgi:hypothetical protein